MGIKFGKSKKVAEVIKELSDNQEHIHDIIVCYIDERTPMKKLLLTTDLDRDIIDYAEFILEVVNVKITH